MTILPWSIEARFRRARKAFVEDPQRLAFLDHNDPANGAESAKSALRQLSKPREHETSSLKAAIEKRNYDLLRVRIAEGVWLNDTFEVVLAEGTSPSTYTPLIVSMINGDIVTLAILLANGASAKLTSKQKLAGIGDEPIIDATNYHNPHYAALLLEHGADPNVKGISGQTPLHYAAMSGDYFATRALLTHGADLSATNDGLPGITGGFTAEQEASKRSQRAFSSVLNRVAREPSWVQDWVLTEDNAGLLLTTQGDGEGYFASLFGREPESLVFYFFDSKERAEQALLALSFVLRTDDTGMLIASHPVQYGAFPAVDHDGGLTWAALVAGKAFASEMFAEAESVFTKHGGRMRRAENVDSRYPANRTDDINLAAIGFEGAASGELAGYPATVYSYTAPNQATALAYLKTWKVDKPGVFVSVSTPVGVFKRDIAGILLE